MDEMTIERWQDPETAGKQGLKLTGSMTIGQAAELKEVFLEALAAASELLVDLSGVTEIDLTGLQLLDASHRSALADGKRFSINDGGNQCFRDTVESAGFRRRVGCERDTTGTCIWIGGEC
jgi:anti-anti-sigma regulatory factor